MTEVDDATRRVRRRRSTAPARRRARVPRQPRRRRARVDARPVPRAARRGRDVVASFPKPFVVAPHYRELPGLDLLTQPEDFPSEPDVMVTFDCGSLARLGDARAGGEGRRRAHRARPPRVEHPLRHHQRDRPDAAASGVIVRRLVDELGLAARPTRPRSALYAALVCDTGRFQYETTTPAVFELARELIEFDVPVSRAVAPAVRGAPVRVPQAARRGAGERRARRRAAASSGPTVTQDMLDTPRRHPRRGRGADRHPPPHHRGRGHLRAEGRGRRLGPREPALAG